MYPDIEGKCRCGCGLETVQKTRKQIITKRNKIIPERKYYAKWYDYEHQRIALIFFGMVKGMPGFFSNFLLQNQDYKCANCNISIESYAELDHDIAIILGGTNIPENWRGLCRDCHLAKTKIDLMCLRLERGTLKIPNNNQLKLAI